MPRRWYICGARSGIWRRTGFLSGRDPPRWRNGRAVEAGVEYPPLRLHSGQVLAAKTRTRRGWGSGGTLGAFASEALGRGLSEHGGFGIATSIVRQLTPKGNTSITAQVTGELHGNTVMKTHE